LELDLLNRQLNDILLDIDKYKGEIKRLTNDLDQETLKRVRLENEKRTLEKEIQFLKAVHEQELAKLRSLQAGAHNDPAQFYRHELERAIRDIRGDFEQLNESQKRELEEWYKIKTEEIQQQAMKRDQLDSSLQLKSESVQSIKKSFNDCQKEYGQLKHLNADLMQKLNQLEEELDNVRRQDGFSLYERDMMISELNAKLHDMLNDYDQLMLVKTSLELEINAYRRLLESEEHPSTRFVSSSNTDPSLSYEFGPQQAKQQAA